MNDKQGIGRGRHIRDTFLCVCVCVIVCLCVGVYVHVCKKEEKERLARKEEVLQVAGG